MYKAIRSCGTTRGDELFEGLRQRGNALVDNGAAPDG